MFVVNISVATRLVEDVWRWSGSPGLCGCGAVRSALGGVRQGNGLRRTACRSRRLALVT